MILMIIIVFVDSRKTCTLSDICIKVGYM